MNSLKSFLILTILTTKNIWCPTTTDANFSAPGSCNTEAIYTNPLIPVKFNPREEAILVEYLGRNGFRYMLMHHRSEAKQLAHEVILMQNPEGGAENSGWDGSGNCLTKEDFQNLFAICLLKIILPTEVFKKTKREKILFYKDFLDAQANWQSLLDFFKNIDSSASQAEQGEWTEFDLSTDPFSDYIAQKSKDAEIAILQHAVQEKTETIISQQEEIERLRAKLTKKNKSVLRDFIKFFSCCNPSSNDTEEAAEAESRSTEILEDNQNRINSAFSDYSNISKSDIAEIRSILNQSRKTSASSSRYKN